MTTTTVTKKFDNQKQTEKQKEAFREMMRQENVNYFDTHHPCKRCRGYVSDGAIICVHCERHDP